MYIGIDIGGTNIKGILFDGKKAVKKVRIITKSKTNLKIILGQIFKCIESMRKAHYKCAYTNKINGIGIGVAGPIDVKNQKILNPPNMTGLKNLELGKIVEKKFKIKTIIDNDVHCLVLAEAILGAGKNKNLVVGLGLGTGVGGGIVMNKEIVYGKTGTAGEFGHMTIDKHGRKCVCGNKGCLEAYLSESGIRKTAFEILGRRIDTITLYNMARKGDSKAMEVWKITGEYLGLGLANIVDTLNPNIIVIGGGIANAGELLLNSAKSEMRKNVLSPKAKKTQVILAKLGEWAGAIGAGLLLDK
ncbi:MAG TPA: ROK family protein [Candidatus Paceibacterota bacterium]|nr:ROK family protein [Candidatus Paceibacterota bacterium]